MNDIKREVLDELFDNYQKTGRQEDRKPDLGSPPPFLVPQLSLASEPEDNSVENDGFYHHHHHHESDEFYRLSPKMDPASMSQGVTRDLDTIMSGLDQGSKDSFLEPSRGCDKADLNLSDLDLDFSHYIDENISDMNINEQDILQMRMDTFDPLANV